MILKLNYLENYITKLLIDYLLINNNSKFNYEQKYKGSLYNKKRYYDNNFEIVKYCLVSKIWFNNISNLISNQIKEYSIEKWFLKDTNTGRRENEFLKGLITIKSFIKFWIPFKNLNQNNNNNNNNNQRPLFEIKELEINKIWSIIKIDDNEIENYLNKKALIKTIDSSKPLNQNLQLFKEIIHNQKLQEIKKIILFGVRLEYILQLNMINEIIPDNFEINCFLDVFNQDLDFQFPIKPFDDYLQREIKCLKVHGCGPIKETLCFIKTKKLTFHAECQSFVASRYNYDQLFNETKQMEYFKIDYSHGGYIEPIQLININSKLPNLKSLSFGLPFFLLIKQINQQHGTEFQVELAEMQTIYSINIRNEWNQMVQTLSNNKTILNLTISNPLYIYNFNHHPFIYDHLLDVNSLHFFIEGLKEIISSNKNIKYLKLINLDFYNEIEIENLFLSSLLYNKNNSIQTLVIKDQKNYIKFQENGECNFFDFLFSKVFNLDDNSYSGYKDCVGSVIRHFKLSYNKFDKERMGNHINIQPFKITSFILKSLLKYQNLSLYTIQLPFDIDENLDDLLNLLNTNCFKTHTSTIHEIILTIGSKFPFESEEIYNSGKKLQKFINEFNEILKTDFKKFNIKFKLSKGDKYYKF